MKRKHTSKNRSGGFSLIELLVSMAIGLIVTLAITTVLVRSEGTKRTTTSVNEIDQTGAYVAYVVDRLVRNAGSGFSQTWNTMYGCLLNASQSSTQVLPPAIPTTSAFAGVTNATMPIRLAPVVIGKGLAAGTGGDVLMVMGGAGGAAELPIDVTPASVTSTQLMVSNSLGFRAGNIILLADTAVPGGCMLQQVGPTFATGSQVIPLAGTYYVGTGATAALTSFGSSTVMAQLGADGASPPKFQLIGVGANNTLVAYDLLQVAGSATTEQSLADGVVEMRAIYGIDTGTPPSGVIGDWVDPVAGSGYESSVLLNGSATSQALLRRIVAVRLGFILRTSLEERAPTDRVTNPEGYLLPVGTNMVLFNSAVNAGGTSLRQTRALAGNDLHYRFRTVEVTIPLLNVLGAP